MCPPGSILAHPGAATQLTLRRAADSIGEDLVGTVIFLASAESDFITGQSIRVSGG